jgi:H+/Cl- antiporter ClcA
MHKKHFHNVRRYVMSTRKWKLRMVFWGGAITIGAVAAVFAMASYESDELFRKTYQSHPLLSLLIPPIGLVVIALLTKLVFKGSEGSGIPQAIASLSMTTNRSRSAILSIKVVLGKILLTCAGLLSGASIGREGPTVHIGAAIMYSLRRIAPFRGKDMTRALILAGGAAGISAAFNTPLAGIMFVVEEMSRSFEERTSGILLIAVILAGITAITILGNYTYFGTSTATTTLIEAWPAVIVCGVLGGFLGGSFSTLLMFLTNLISNFARQHPFVLALGCGLMISLFGFLSGGQTFGTGYHEAKEIMTDSVHPDMMFPIYKYMATIVSYLSGIPGGIFAPSLSIGAGMGASFSDLFPYVPLAVLAMLGMVGYFTGVAPWK